MESNYENGMTPTGFAEWKGDRILIAGSSDVHHERELLETVIREALKLGPPTEKPISPYSWDIETSIAGLEQDRSMQRGIPLPSAQECRGVVCLIG